MRQARVKNKCILMTETGSIPSALHMRFVESGKSKCNTSLSKMNTAHWQLFTVAVSGRKVIYIYISHKSSVGKNRTSTLKPNQT